MEKHFNGEAPANPYGGGMDSAYAQLHEATGKTIERVRYGSDPSTNTRPYEGQYVVLEFDDGTALELKIGTDVLSTAWGLERTTVRVEPGGIVRTSALRFAFVAHFREGEDATDQQATDGAPRAQKETDG